MISRMSRRSRQFPRLFRRGANNADSTSTVSDAPALTSSNNESQPYTYSIASPEVSKNDKNESPDNKSSAPSDASATKTDKTDESVKSDTESCVPSHASEPVQPDTKSFAPSETPVKKADDLKSMQPDTKSPADSFVKHKIKSPAASPAPPDEVAATPVHAPFNAHTPIMGADKHEPNYDEGTLLYKLKNHTLTGDTEWPFGDIFKADPEKGVTVPSNYQDFTIRGKDFTLGHLKQIHALLIESRGEEDPQLTLNLEACVIFAATPHDADCDGVFEKLGRQVQTECFALNAHNEVCMKCPSTGNLSAPVLAIDHPDPDISVEKLLDMVHSQVGHDDMNGWDFGELVQKECQIEILRWVIRE